MSNWVWFQDALGKGITQFTLTATSGAYALTGFGVGASIAGTVTSYTLTGEAAGLDYGRVVVAGVTDYALTGNAIGSFIREHRLNAARGEYKIAPENALLIRTKIPVTDPAPYVERAWVQPENEGNLGADLEWEA